MSWKSKVILQQGDITEADVDAVVNAANTRLQLGAGVAGAIRRKGGPTIQQECDVLGPVSLGEAALTSEDSLRDATVNSLKRAVEKQLTSIAFPAIGTGVAGFPIQRCAQVMLEEVKQHLNSATTLERVLFILFDLPALQTFQQTLTAMPG